MSDRNIQATLEMLCLEDDGTVQPWLQRSVEYIKNIYFPDDPSSDKPKSIKKSIVDFFLVVLKSPCGGRLLLTTFQCVKTILVQTFSVLRRVRLNFPFGVGIMAPVTINRFGFKFKERSRFWLVITGCSIVSCSVMPAFYTGKPQIIVGLPGLMGCVGLFSTWRAYKAIPSFADDEIGGN